jgi:hypothetical protein
LPGSVLNVGSGATSIGTRIDAGNLVLTFINPSLNQSSGELR